MLTTRALAASWAGRNIDHCRHFSISGLIETPMDERDADVWRRRHEDHNIEKLGQRKSIFAALSHKGESMLLNFLRIESSIVHELWTDET